MEIPQEALIAAKWWADRLRFGAKQQVATRGLTSELLTLELVLAATSREQQTLTAAQIDDFESILSKSLAAFFASEKSAWERAKENPNCGSALRMLEVDYGACDLLRAAHQAAGGQIYAMVWPIKTAMWIDPGSVKVRYGYGAPVVELMDG
jgi:hypothetical protein